MPDDKPFSPTYIKDMECVNIGPISHIHITPRFTEEGYPLPIVFVGENGSGKSTVLSLITDSLLEVAGKAFNNAFAEGDTLGHHYYKILSGSQIKIGEKFLFSYVNFSNERTYLFKSGEISFEDSKQFLPSLSSTFDWEGENNYKGTDFSKEESEALFSNEAICCFHPIRYERPAWMGDRYYNSNNFPSLSIEPIFSGEIRNRILADNCITETLQWLLDVIADSRRDIDVDTNGNIHLLHADRSSIHEAILSANSRKNIEAVMSLILGQEVYFDLNNRNAGMGRFNLKSSETGQIICPSLDSLSTGELALFELFATIVRYADRLDSTKSNELDQICGIAIIDEIDLHLHPKLQFDLLPKLIRMFSRIQFILTTHSPLVLLGIERAYGKDMYSIHQLPSGELISPEEYEEFEGAYRSFAETERHKKELQRAILQHGSRPLIITEGTTDWRHLKAMKEELQRRRPEQAANLFENDYDFLEFSPSDDNRCAIPANMGNDQLVKLCKGAALVSQNTKCILIFIADSDDSRTNSSLDGQPFKSHGNGVYSFILPTPDHRKDQQGLSIEQLYTDKTMKQLVTVESGANIRLYTSDEFDSYGRFKGSESLMVRGNIHGAKDGTIKVIDGGNVRLLSTNTEDDTNHALSKIAFANASLDKKLNITTSDIDSFVPVFETIKQIIESAR